MSPEAIVSGIADIAETLAHLHAASFYHRDIKPSNLLRYSGRWVLADFGLVTFPDKNDNTPVNTKLGPEHFLAPEMQKDATSANNGAADVYSLAKTLWALLTDHTFPPPGEHRISSELFRLESWVPNNDRVRQSIQGQLRWIML